jgi:hypothetical protein
MEIVHLDTQCVYMKKCYHLFNQMLKLNFPEKGEGGDSEDSTTMITLFSLEPIND